MAPTQTNRSPPFPEVTIASRTGAGFGKQAARGVAEEFIDSFFGRSASELVMSLLGYKKLKPAEIARLRALLDSQSANRKPENHEP